jgi:dipeptidyl aminopeptidase/acylaminoacyl peptidase
MVEKAAELYRAAGGDVELALFPGMPHGLAGWSETETSRMLTCLKQFIAQRLATTVAAS